MNKPNSLSPPPSPSSYVLQPDSVTTAVKTHTLQNGYGKTNKPQITRCRRKPPEGPNVRDTLPSEACAGAVLCLFPPTPPLRLAVRKDIKRWVRLKAKMVGEEAQNQ